MISDIAKSAIDIFFIFTASSLKTEKASVFNHPLFQYYASYQSVREHICIVLSYKLYRTTDIMVLVFCIDRIRYRHVEFQIRSFLR